MRWTCFLLLFLIEHPNYYLKTNIFDNFLIWNLWQSSRQPTVNLNQKTSSCIYNSSSLSTNCFRSIGCLAPNLCCSVSFLYFWSRPVEFIMAEFKNYGHAIGSLNILRIQLTSIQNNHIYSNEMRPHCGLLTCVWTLTIGGEEGRLASVRYDYQFRLESVTNPAINFIVYIHFG